MKLIIQNNRVAATATDSYDGPDFWVQAPIGFLENRAHEYIYENDQLTLPVPPAPSQWHAYDAESGLWTTTPENKILWDRSTAWERVKALRDSKAQNGGFSVDGQWFHSDVFSRVQQLGLVVMGAGIPPGLQWKVMGGGFVAINPGKAQGVFAAAAAQDQAMFAHAETLKAQIDAAEDPSSVDITIGWPATFE